MKMTRRLAGLAVLGGCLWAAGLARAADDAKGGDDKDFAKKASAEGLGEVNLSNLALVRGGPEVREFARKAVAFHQRANRQLVDLANRKSLSLAATMDATHKKLEAKLSTLKGADFDRTYVEAMVKDHEAAVKLFEKESKDGKDAALKAWAGKTLPTLKEHLKMAKDLDKKVKGTGKP